MSNPARVLQLISDDMTTQGCYAWRVWQPTAELDRQGFRNVGWDYFNNPLLQALWQAYDVIVMPRMAWKPEDRDVAMRWFDLVHGAGKAVVFEMDDDLLTSYIVERLTLVHGKTSKEAQEISEAMAWALGQCDGVTVSSEHLAWVVRQYTDRPVQVVPNFIDLRFFQGMRAQNRRWVKPLTIGWAGGIRPDGDLNLMAEAWGRIARRFAGVTFVVMGHIAQVIYDHVPEGRVVAIPWMPVDEYPAGLLNIDIGCCPLEDTPFNRSKTPIKAMEYGALGAAVVASPTLYRQLIEDGVDGYICETADEWEAALADLVGSANRRNRMAQALGRKLAAHHSLEGNVWRWLAAWDDIYADFRRRQTHIFLPAGVSYARPTA